MLHVLAGVAAGAALSVTHGTIARSANPHRLFAIVGMALGVFAVVFLAATPQLIAALGGAALFHAFAGVMAVGAVAALLAFPLADAGAGRALPAAKPAPLPRAVWFGIVGISCMDAGAGHDLQLPRARGHRQRGFERRRSMAC